jgi:hypothetical protein
MDEKSFLSKKHKREDTEGAQISNETSEKNGDNKQQDAQSSNIGSKSTKNKDNNSKKENNKEPPAKLFVSKIDDSQPVPFEE